MRHIACLCIAASSAILVSLPQRAHGEPVVAESIEWIILSSEWVLVGKVIATTSITESDGRTFEKATIAVERTLKGKPAERAEFVLRPWLGSIAKEWKQEGIPMVFFLVRMDGEKDKATLPKAEWVLRDSFNDPSMIPLAKTMSSRQLCVITRDFAIATKPDAILACLRSALADSPKETTRRSHEVRVPAGTPASKHLWSGSSVWLVVPIDAKLEKLGRRLCVATSYLERIEGAKILRYFKSDGNVEILKGLLKDPDYSIVTSGRLSEAGFKITGRHQFYEVRRLALEQAFFPRFG